MGGQRRLEARFQGNNIVNHPAFGYPDASFTSGTFGAIGGNGSCLERQFQVSVRFILLDARIPRGALGARRRIIPAPVQVSSVRINRHIVAAGTHR